jgi:predicted GIY-YIG superfamily endonuclease
MQSKHCRVCKTDKPISDYYTIVNKKTGNVYTYNYCKKCHYSKYTKHTAKKWREENPERWLEDVNKATKEYWARQKKGVYLLVTDIGLYIGATDKFDSRVTQHKNKNFKGNVGYKGATIISTSLLEEINDRKLRLQRERYWIEKIQPELNVMYTDRWMPNFLINNPKKK